MKRSEMIEVLHEALGEYIPDNESFKMVRKVLDALKAEQAEEDSWDAQIIADIEAGKWDHVRDEALRIQVDIEDLVDEEATDVVLACDPKHAELVSQYLLKNGIGHACGLLDKGFICLTIFNDELTTPAEQVRPEGEHQ